MFNFGAGTTHTQLQTAVNLVSDLDRCHRDDRRQPAQVAVVGLRIERHVSAKAFGRIVLDADLANPHRCGTPTGTDIPGPQQWRSATAMA